MYNCPRCKVPLNEIVVGEYKCPECDWFLSERYVQAWWDGYNACAAEHHAHLTPESLASSQTVVNASALEQSDGDSSPAQAQVA